MKCKILPLFLILNLFLISCTAHHHHYAVIIHSDFESEGFLSNDLFQVKSIGRAGRNTISILNRRKDSIRNAYNNGIERSIDLIVAEIVKIHQAEKPEYELEVVPESLFQLRSRIRKYAINGQIVKKQFFSDGSCSIVLRLELKDLKKALLNLSPELRRKASL